MLTGEIDPEDYAAGFARSRNSATRTSRRKISPLPGDALLQAYLFFVSLGVFFLAALVVLLWARGAPTAACGS